MLKQALVSLKPIVAFKGFFLHIMMFPDPNPQVIAPFDFHFCTLKEKWRDVSSSLDVRSWSSFFFFGVEGKRILATDFSSIINWAFPFPISLQEAGAKSRIECYNSRALYDSMLKILERFLQEKIEVQTSIEQTSSVVV